MQKLFSTEQFQPYERYRKWQEFSDGRFLPMEQTKLGDKAFHASVQGADIGDLAISRVAFSALSLTATAQTVRSPRNKPDLLAYCIKLAGTGVVSQRDRMVRQDPGEFSIVDPNEPFQYIQNERTGELVIHVPRDRIERMVGPARNFTALAPTSNMPTTSLVKSFFQELIRRHDQLTPDAATRMITVGVDLIVASITERMAQETPKPLRGTVTVQRAKAYIEAQFGQADLDPPQVAAAVGVSLRHLHALFGEHGQNVADWIWQRRLETAAQRLADPAFAQVPLGGLAFGCGFLSQAHFSRRFKERFDVTPSDYRRAALEQGD